MYIHHDCETYSTLDLKVVGAYRYAEDPSTEVLIWCYALGDGTVRTWLPWKHRAMPPELVAAARRGNLFCAHNAMFERAIWEGVLRRNHGAPPTRPEQWVCTAVLAAQAALPRKLEGAGAAIGVKNQKDTENGKLTKVFCQPRKPTKADPSTRVLPTDRPDDFNRFITYCQQDVRSERDLHNRLPPLPDHEQKLYALDLTINERGLPIDIPFVQKARPIVMQLGGWATQRSLEITGGIKPTQVAKLRQWVFDQGLEVNNLQRATLEPHLVDPKVPAHVRELLDIRLEAGIVSTKKFDAMLRVCSPADHRARGTILFYGAHTGRWSGKLIQPHNFKRGTLKPHEQEHVYIALEHGDAELLLRLWDNPITAVSMCMRGFIKAPDGRTLYVVDYTAIEARVLAWLAGEAWLLAAFAKGLDVYKLMAAKLYATTIEAVTSEQRRIAKNLVLGCGYQLGAKNFVAYCARAGVYVTEEFSSKAVGSYRAENKMIVRSWYDCERAAIAAVQDGKPVRWSCVTFAVQDRWLTIRLPSGRCLYYLDPKVSVVMAFDKPKLQLTFREEYNGQMYRNSTYGGKLIENIVQAIARDLLANGMLQAEEHGYPIVGTVHDEIINENDGHGSIKEFEHVVCKLPAWAKGVPMGAEGFETVRYRKG